MMSACLLNYYTKGSSFFFFFFKFTKVFYCCKIRVGKRNLFLFGLCTKRGTQMVGLQQKIQPIAGRGNKHIRM